MSKVDDFFNLEDPTNNRAFDDWNHRGYVIIKGSKAVAFENGIALFSPEQVKKAPPKKRWVQHPDNDYYLSREEDSDFACAYDLYW